MMVKSNYTILREKLFLYRYMYFYWWDQFEQVEGGCSIGTHLVGPAPLFSLTHSLGFNSRLADSFFEINFNLVLFNSRLTGAILSKLHFEHKLVGVSRTEWSFTRKTVCDIDMDVDGDIPAVAVSKSVLLISEMLSASLFIIFFVNYQRWL